MASYSLKSKWATEKGKASEQLPEAEWNWANHSYFGNGLESESCVVSTSVRVCLLCLGSHLPHVLVVRISGFHPGGPGSIPGAGRPISYSRVQSMQFPVTCPTCANSVRFRLGRAKQNSTWENNVSQAHAWRPAVFHVGIEHSTADREVPGANPGVPHFFEVKFTLPKLFKNRILNII